MTERWYLAQGVSASTLAQVLRHAGLCWIYAERTEDTVLDFATNLLEPDSVALERWSHGRAFDERMELAWWRTAHGCELRAILNEGVELPSGTDWVEDPLSGSFEAIDVQGTINLLVGDLDPSRDGDAPSWSTARVPRRLHYPVGTPPVLTQTIELSDEPVAEQQELGSQDKATAVPAADSTKRGLSRFLQRVRGPKAVGSSTASSEVHVRADPEDQPSEQVQETIAALPAEIISVPSPNRVGLWIRHYRVDGILREQRLISVKGVTADG